jgi:hypothetical protein
MPGFKLVRLKNKPMSSDNNTVETVEPENKKIEIIVANEQNNQQKKNQTTNTKLTYEEINGKETTKEKETEEKQKEPEIIMPTVETEKSSVAEMKIITNRSKERVTCGNCQKSFGTPLFMYDYGEGSRKLVGCCPFCNEIIGKTHSKKVTEIVAPPEIEKIEKPTRLQENAKKRDPTTFQVNSEELEELIKNTAYVR